MSAPVESHWPAKPWASKWQTAALWRTVYLEDLWDFATKSDKEVLKDSRHGEKDGKLDKLKEGDKLLREAWDSWDRMSGKDWSLNLDWSVRVAFRGTEEEWVEMGGYCLINICSMYEMSVYPVIHPFLQVWSPLSPWEQPKCQHLYWLLSADSRTVDDTAMTTSSYGSNQRHFSTSISFNFKFFIEFVCF